MNPELLTTVAGLRSRCDDWRREGLRVGVVPTMGALHQGHLSLIHRALDAADRVLVTVFVNPLQFAAGEDLSAYPRPLADDVASSGHAGAHTVFAPSNEEMYPRPVVTTVTVNEAVQTMEGGSRPEHFAGVATVVTKLFSIIGPSVACFGEKDYQQLAMVRRLVDDLSIPVEIVGCPTMRHSDGLAMSSRNVYLSADQRKAAPVLNRALRRGAELIRSGAVDVDEIRASMAEVVAAEPLARVDYLEVVDPQTLVPEGRATRRSRLFGAVAFGTTRLIDNIAADSPNLVGAQ